MNLMCRPLTMFLAVCLLMSGSQLRGDDLPDDAARLLAELDSEVAAVQTKAEQEIKSRTSAYIKILQEMQTAYTRAGKLDEAVAIRDRIRSLEASAVGARPNPGTLTAFRSQIGKSYVFEVMGSTDGSIWGTDVYTDDSALSVAAVHAGVLRNGQRGIVRVTILPGASRYRGSTRNGVTTSPYESFPGSYRVDPGPGSRPGSFTLVEGNVSPGSLTNLRDRVGESFQFEVTGRLQGPVWGTDLYTDDSDLGTAAVHAGLLRVGQRGTVRVTILPGQDRYEGSDRNGVSSNYYGTFGGSYRVVGVRNQKINPILPALR